MRQAFSWDTRQPAVESVTDEEFIRDPNTIETKNYCIFQNILHAEKKHVPQLLGFLQGQTRTLEKIVNALKELRLRRYKTKRFAKIQIHHKHHREKCVAEKESARKDKKSSKKQLNYSHPVCAGMAKETTYEQQQKNKVHGRPIIRRK